MSAAPAVPAVNVYFMLCYAWEWLEALDLVDAGAAETDCLEDLLSKALAEGTSNLLRRGLDRVYREYEEETRMPRGAVDVAATVKRQLRSRSMVACTVDQLSYDFLNNQLIAATLRRMLGARIDRAIARDLRMVASRFPNVSTIDPTPARFGAVRLHRNAHSYRFILNLCELLTRRLVPDSRGSGFGFHDVRYDASEMGLLFQAFVRNFLAREQRYFSVGAEIVQWDRCSWAIDTMRLPVMRTDVSLVSPWKKVVVETKYTDRVFATSFGGNPKVRSDHLYQLFAYLKNLEVRGGLNASATGVLLYGTSGHEVQLRYELGGHELLVVALDLSRDWPGIRAQLMALIEAHVPSVGITTSAPAA